MSTPALSLRLLCVCCVAEWMSCAGPSSLPGMADVELDVAERVLKLSSPGFAEVNEALPAPVAFEAATAKFSKKTHIVTVTVPLR